MGTAFQKKTKNIIILDYLMVFDSETFHNYLLSTIATAVNVPFFNYPQMFLKHCKLYNDNRKGIRAAHTVLK